jgi:hypothetical protein
VVGDACDNLSVTRHERDLRTSPVSRERGQLRRLQLRLQLRLWLWLRRLWLRRLWLRRLRPTAFDPTDFDPTAFDPTDVDPTAFDPTDVDPTAFDPTDVDPTAFDPTAFDPTVSSKLIDIPERDVCPERCQPTAQVVALRIALWGARSRPGSLTSDDR